MIELMSVLLVRNKGEALLLEGCTLARLAADGELSRIRERYLDDREGPLQV
jgi:hypothetical protein